MDSKAHWAEMLPDVFKKIIFFVNPRTFALCHFLSPDRDYEKFICGADVVQKCEDFKKNIFFRNMMQHFHPVRFAIHEKVNFHEKN